MDSPDKDWWIVHTGEYVLGLLDEQDTRVLERVLQHEPDVARMVGDWGNWFQPLSDSLTPIEPPAHSLPMLLNNLPQQSRRASAGTRALNGTTATSEHNANFDESGAQAKTTHQHVGIDESASVMRLLQSNQQKTDRWRAFAGLAVAGCLMMCLYVGAVVST